MKYSKHFMNSDIARKVSNILNKSINIASSKGELDNFLDDLLSPAEKSMLAKRIAIAYMIMEDKYSYEDIIKTLKVSDGTVAKVNSVLTLKGKGYKQIVGKMLTKKIIKGILSEFLDLITPKRRTLAGEVYLKPQIESQKSNNQPL